MPPEPWADSGVWSEYVPLIGATEWPLSGPIVTTLVVFGVVCERYLIVIPGQTHPPVLFPGMEITSSMFPEGAVSYRISKHELFQALGVLALVGFMFVLGLRVLRLLPTEARIHEKAESA